MSCLARTLTVVLVFVVFGLAPIPTRAAMTLKDDAKKESSAASQAPPPKPPVPPSAAGPSAPTPPAQPVPPIAPPTTSQSPPAPAATRPGQLVPPKKPDLVGTVIYVSGARVVAEVKGGVKEKERFRLYDSASRLRGEATALKALDDATFLLEPVGSATIGVGDRLARVSE